MPITPKKYMNETRTQELITEIKKVCKPKPKIVTWSDGTDEEIVALIQGLDDGTITTEEIGWDVGDERIVHLNAIAAGDNNVAQPDQDATLVIMNKGPYNGIGHFVVGVKQLLNQADQMETSNTNANGWHNSRGRKCCDALFNMIPSTLNPIFKTFTVTTATNGGSNTPGVTTQSGKLSLFAEKEVFGSKAYSCKSEYDSSDVPEQMAYYATTAHRKKELFSGYYYKWFLRSPSYNSSDNFCIVTNSGSQDSTIASESIGLSPFGVI